MKKPVLLLLPVFILACNRGGGDTQSATIQSDGSARTVRTGIEVGDRAPELVYASPDGENLSLSSLRGKVVLIDFWASWCAPCRRENPNLVKTYKQFRDKSFLNGEGFEIYGVSLDKDKRAWMDAIRADNLMWEYHVSDLKGAASEPGAIYNIMAIPANLLIDGDGIILAKNLRGEMLDDKLRALKK